MVEMALVILVIGLLMGISLSLVQSLALLRTSKGEAKKLAASLMQAKNAAVKSKQAVYFEINLDEESYRAYRISQRLAASQEKEEEKKTQEKAFIKRTQLSEAHSILYVQPAVGDEITNGLLKLRFLPSGLGEEIAIYLGPDSGSVEATVIYEKYTGKAFVYTGEKEHRLEQEGWEELDLTE